MKLSRLQFLFGTLLSACAGGREETANLDRCPNAHYQQPVVVGDEEINGLRFCYCSQCRVNYMSDWSMEGGDAT